MLLSNACRDNSDSLEELSGTSGSIGVLDLFAFEKCYLDATLPVKRLTSRCEVWVLYLQLARLSRLTEQKRLDMRLRNHIRILEIESIVRSLSRVANNVASLNSQSVRVMWLSRAQSSARYQGTTENLRERRPYRQVIALASCQNPVCDSSERPFQ